MWNFCCALRQPLLSMFKHRVLVDLDPGIVQIPAQNKIDLNVLDHHAFLTVGTKLHDPDCQVPTLGVTWNRFLPPAFLPMWTMADDPGTDAPFSTVTQWTWKNMVVNDRVVPKNKRTAYSVMWRYLSGPGSLSNSQQTSRRQTRRETASCCAGTDGALWTRTVWRVRRLRIDGTSGARARRSCVRSPLTAT